MDGKDRKQFLDDFKKADVPKKLDMWYFALEQEALWTEILSELSEIANEQKLKKNS